MRTDPQSLRVKAQETLALAKRTMDKENEAYLENVAKRYEELAAEAEKR